MAVTLAALVARFGGELVGDGGRAVSQVAPLDRATPDEIGFVSQSKYLPQLADTRAGAVILPADARDATDLPRILTPNPYLYFARVSALLNPPPCPPAGIHSAATVAPDAQIAADASIAAGAVIGSGAVIGARTVIGPNCVVGDQARVGADCLLHANVTLYHRCEVGDRAILHSGCVIGSDGFGFAPNDGRWEKIPQIGRVLIGEDVEVGACTTIDRGALEDTVIEDDVKLDNQIQIGHNCRIGSHTAVAGCVGIAGSTVIGRNCRIGGAAMIAGHLSIIDGCTISAGTLVAKSIADPGPYAGTFPLMPHRDWRYAASELRRLRILAERVTALERALAARDNEGGSAS